MRYHGEPMKQTVIPWHVLWEALKKLPKGKRRDEWLQHWFFGEKGAVLAKGKLKLKIPSHRASRRQKEADLLIRDWMKNRPKVLH